MGKAFRHSLAAAAAWTGAALAQGPCGDWADPHAISVEVGPGEDLTARVRAAASGTTLFLLPGVYKIASPLQFTRDDVTLRSKSGKREDVVLDGDAAGGGKPSGFVPEIITVAASGVVLADITVKRARDHAIHAFPPAGRAIARFRARNLHVSDCGQQLIKVNSNGGNPLYWADSGTIECSFIGFLDNSVMEPSGDGFYTGGIDIHGGRGWSIRSNLFRNIQREGKGMEHAVHLWSKSRDCVVEGNRFEDVYRAVGLGMKTAAAGLERRYPDGKGDSPYADFVGGMVRNNMVFNRAGIRLESGIEIMNAVDAAICHNTVFSMDRPFSGIEYRWPNTRVIIRNNLVSQSILRRDEAQGVLEGNMENAVASLFADAAKGDLHLAAASPAVGQGIRLAPGQVDRDMDGDARDSLPDVGADEYVKPGSRARRAGAEAPPSGREGVRRPGASTIALGGKGPGKALHRADGRRLGATRKAR